MRARASAPAARWRLRSSPRPPRSRSAPLRPHRPALHRRLRLGYTTGDQWEPSIAADRFGHVYMLYPQYGGVPGCSPTCPSPTMIFQISADRGATWAPPVQIAAPGAGQWDAQIAVDPIDGRTVYAAWLAEQQERYRRRQIDDFGVDLVDGDCRSAPTPAPTSRSWWCAGQMCTSATITRRQSGPRPRTMAAQPSPQSR